MKHYILCINSGSSSIKFALYQIQSTEKIIASGAVEQIGLPGGWLWLKDGKDKFLVDSHKDFPDQNEADQKRYPCRRNLYRRQHLHGSRNSHQ